MSADSKLRRLKEMIGEMDSCLLAFSGGTDSSFLLAVCSEILKDRLLAVTGVSPLVPGTEISRAKSFTRRLKTKHLLVTEVLPKGFWDNPAERCYLCKKALFNRFKKIAAARKLRWVIDASNSDDRRDYRPGERALEDLKVRSPLKEAGLTKKDIRMLSRRMKLSTWNIPAAACLASRIPYGERITPEKLSRIGKAEEFLAGLGFKRVRARLHGDLCRLEVDEQKIPELVRLRKNICRKFKQLGLSYITVDIAGYRCGSHNEALGWKKRR